MRQLHHSVAATWFAVFIVTATMQAAEPIDIGSRRELFVDHHLIGSLSGVRLVLHRPEPREIVFRFDQPWEGLYSGYETVLKDGETYRFYYRGMPEAKHDLDTEVTCVAESKDGIHWTRPKLGIYEVHGTKANNVVLARNRGCHNLAPFIDTNPDCPANQRYKALGGTGSPGLLAFASADGLNWKQLQADPVITKGAFDSQNNAFWSPSEQQYVCYFRVFREGTRWIARTTSKDFIHWSEPIDLELGGQPREHLYTNQFDPYVRAPHIYLGLPTRYLPGRRVLTDDEARRIGTPTKWNYVNDCTDILLASARWRQLPANVHGGLRPAGRGPAELDVASQLRRTRHRADRSPRVVSLREASFRLSVESRPAVRHPTRRFRLGAGSLRGWRVYYQAIYLFRHEVVAQLRHIGSRWTVRRNPDGRREAD